jgi:hypothetical protein
VPASVAGALGDAPQRFRKLRGYRDMKLLSAALAARCDSVDMAELKAA